MAKSPGASNEVWLFGDNEKFLVGLRAELDGKGAKVTLMHRHVDKALEVIEEKDATSLSLAVVCGFVESPTLMDEIIAALNSKVPEVPVLAVDGVSHAGVVESIHPDDAFARLIPVLAQFGVEWAQ